MHDHSGCACCSTLLGDAYREQRQRELHPLALTILLRRFGDRNAAIGATLLAAGELPRSSSSERTFGQSDPDAAALGTRVFVGGTVLPVDAAFSEAEALAIRNGRVLAFGRRNDVLREAGKDAEVIDVGGRIILPGFVEPHMHLIPVAMASRWENVGVLNCDNIEAVIARLRQKAQNTEAGDWVLAGQVDPSLQDGADALSATLLDHVSQTHPVLVLNASLHFGYCNSAALRLAGIDRNTPDPSGAVFVRGGDGAPNGVLKGGGALLRVLRAARAMAGLDPVEAGLSVCRKANSVGITTFCDQATGAFGGPSDIATYRAMAASGRMTARLRYSLLDALGAEWDGMGLSFGQGDALVRATGWKIVADGSNQGRTGCQREPYLNSNETGLAYVDPQALKEKVERRLRQGWQVVVHGNGDRTIDAILDAYEAARTRGVSLVRRPRIEHCSILHDDQIARIKDLGVSPSFLIGHVYYWGKAFRDTIFGPQKAALLDRAASCERAGITWTLHSDDPVTGMDPLRCIHNAVTRQMWREPDNALAPEECVPVQAAIRSMTRDAAWQCHSEHEVGSLEPGKFADLVMLSEDPRKVDPLAIKDIQVVETWMNGRKVWDDA
ncbi:MAG: amidohydrolase [Alphaproteobacteria bacterium]|nr:amidohydrolase [Alphaproteobacteria bacterium]